MTRSSWLRFWSPPRTRVAPRRRFASLHLEALEARSLPAVLSLDPSTSLTEHISARAEADLFHIEIPETGRLTAEVRASGTLDTRLSLLDGGNRVLVQSEAQAPDDPDDRIVMHLLPGSYSLRVEGLRGATGDYALTTEFVAAVPPGQLIPTTTINNGDVKGGDFNNDGVLDLLVITHEVPYFSVLLGVGDGTFAPDRPVSTGYGYDNADLGDFNQDGNLDVAVSNHYLNHVLVLLGRGDGSFTDGGTHPVGRSPWYVSVADYNDDGLPDVAAGNSGSFDVSFYLGRGDGTFEEEWRLPVPDGVNYLLADDFNRDGLTDLAVDRYEHNEVEVFLKRPDGTFAPAGRYGVGLGPEQMAAADLNGDGVADLVIANSQSTYVSVLLGNPDGTFAPQQRHPAPAKLWQLAAADFDADGRLDVALSGESQAVLRGLGGGALAGATPHSAGFWTNGVVAGDFDGDGRQDLAFSRSDSRVFVMLGRGDGTFPDLGPPVTLGEVSYPVVDDFDRDGRIDLVLDVFEEPVLFRGLGDGSFRPPVPALSLPPSVADLASTYHTVRAAGDFDGDSLPDLLVETASGLQVHLGRGDGTFRPAPQTTFFAVSAFHYLTADFDGDGALDVAAVYVETGEAAVFLGRGDGTLAAPAFYDAGLNPGWIAAADFNGDGRPDLAVVNTASFDVSVLLNRGDGTFEPEVRYPTGAGPFEVVAADFDGDGVQDLATTNYLSRDVAVLRGRGDGTFAEAEFHPVGDGPLQLIAADLDGDGRTDLVSGNYESLDLSLLFNRGDGFAPEVRLGEGRRMQMGAFYRHAHVTDLDGDGRADLLTNDFFTSSLVVFMGQGGGAFAEPRRYVTGTSLAAAALAADDVNGDGRPDVVAVNPSFGVASVATGWGDGTFADPAARAVGDYPVAVLSLDVNRDGRPDLVTANYRSDDVSVALGLGDGTYQAPSRFAVGAAPAALAAGDFDGDGRTDLAVANSGSDDVSILLGNGDGTFALRQRQAVGAAPFSLLASDLDGDGLLDLVVGDYLDDGVSVLRGRGDGTFAPALRTAAGASPIALAAGDFDRDGRTDLAAANYVSDEVAVLLRRPDGTFAPPRTFAVGAQPRSLAAADLDGDGLLDLVTANSNSDDVSLLRGRGDGSFSAEVRFAVTGRPTALAVTDFNDDGRLDLITGNQLNEQTSVLLGLPDGRFVSPEVVAGGIRSTPQVADFNGDGAADVAVLERGGDVLVRLGRPDSPGAFQAPVIVNHGFPARDLTVVATASGPRLAAVDARTASISLYAPTAGGVVRIAGPSIPGALPTRLESGDLDGDGWGDLVAAASGSAEAFVYLQRSGGGFGTAPDARADVGLIPTDVELIDLDGDGWRDVVVTSQYSGDVRVLLNDAETSFSTTLHFRAGTLLYNLTETAIRSGEGTTAVVAGHFDSDGLPDLVAINGDANSFSVLLGAGTGGVTDPHPELSFATGQHPTFAVSGRFDADAFADLAVLNEATGDLSIYLGDGSGGFVQQPFTLDAGNAAAGLAAFDVNGDGRLDLLVGNEYGDVLTLMGNGDGSFQPYQRAGRHVALAAADLNGDGREDFVLGSESLDRLSVRYSQPGQADVWGREDGVLAPGAVGVADLNADGRLDVVLANSGANNVLVFLGEEGGFGAARRFATGTSPVGVTVQDLNGDGLADLAVANEGSNDVTLLLGRGGGEAWTLAPGPRLNAGSGPVSATAADLTGDGVLDLLVSNQQSDNVFLLPGVGNGFFDDRAPTILPTGVAPRQALVGQFDTRPGLDVVTVNSGELSFFTGADLATPRIISLGSAAPLTALVGDFDFDGFSDLLVANRDDGTTSLFVADEGGPRLAGVFSHPEVEHPTALALVDAGSELKVYLTGEGEESAFLLTSFGVLVPGGEVAEAESKETGIQLTSFGILVPTEVGGTERRPIDGVLVVEGPGLSPTDVLAPAAEGESSGEAQAAPDGDEPAPSGSALSKAPFVIPDVSRGEGGAGEEVEEEDAAAEDPDAADAEERVTPSTRLMLGAEEALRQRRNGLDGGVKQDEEVTPGGHDGASPQMAEGVPEQASLSDAGISPRSAEADLASDLAGDEATQGGLPANEVEDGAEQEGAVLSWRDVLSRPLAWAPFLLAASAAWVGRGTIRRRLLRWDGPPSK